MAYLLLLFFFLIWQKRVEKNRIIILKTSICSLKLIYRQINNSYIDFQENEHLNLKHVIKIKLYCHHFYVEFVFITTIRMLFF